MAIIPGPVVPGPAPLRRRYGLFDAAGGPVALPEHGSSGGVRYDPESCGTARVYAIACAGGAVLTPDKSFDPSDDLVEALPFAVYASIECGAIGYTAAEFEAKVQRRLMNGEQGAVELALWTGEDVDGNDLGINAFTNSPSTLITPGDDMDIVSLVSAIEDWAYRDQGYGNVAYIHAPVSVAAHAAEAMMLVDDGRIKRTPFGSVWVFGGGYPGTGDGGEAPPAGGDWLYVTGQTTVWRSSDVFTYPTDQTMDRSTNQRHLIAEREYAVGFDCILGRSLFNPLGGS